MYLCCLPFLFTDSNIHGPQAGLCDVADIIVMTIFFYLKFSPHLQSALALQQIFLFIFCVSTLPTLRVKGGERFLSEVLFSIPSSLFFMFPHLDLR